MSNIYNFLTLTLTLTLTITLLVTLTLTLIAGRNLVVANVPGRDIEEYNAFPKEDIAWIRKWFAWADQEGSALRRTIPLLGYEYPRLGQVTEA